MPLGLLDLSFVTERLIGQLNACASTSPIDPREASPPYQIKYIGLAPDAARKLTEPSCVVSVYLFHVAADKFNRNTFPTGGSAQRIPEQPLALTLYYLLTAYSRNSSETAHVEEQQAMSIAIKCFYENPIVRATIPSLSTKGEETEEEFTLTLEPQSVDEMGRLWQSFSSSMRLSAVYRVSVIFIEPPPPRAAQAVRFLPQPEPIPFEVLPAGPSPATATANAGGRARVTVEEAGFVAKELEVRLRALVLERTTTDPPGAGQFRFVDSEQFDLQVPPYTPSGRYLVSVRPASDKAPLEVWLDVPIVAGVIADQTGLAAIAISGARFIARAPEVKIGRVTLAKTNADPPGAGQFCVVDQETLHLRVPNPTPSGRHLLTLRPAPEKARLEIWAGRAMSGAARDVGLAEAVELLGRPASNPASEPAFLTRIRLRARRRVLWLRSLWAADAASGLGLVISHDEVDRILADPGDLARAEIAFYDGDPVARALAAPIRAADFASVADELIGRFRRDFSLRAADVDLLTLTIAVEADPWLRRVFGYLHDDATSGLPTPWLARQLFQWPAGTQLGPDSGLIHWRLARPSDAQASPWSVSASWLVDPHIASCFLHGISLDPRLAGSVRFVPPSIADVGACLYPAELAAMASFVRALAKEGSPSIEIVVAGPAGAGKRRLAMQLAEELQVPLLIADAGRLMGPGADPAATGEALIQVTRTARLMRAAVYWHDADSALPNAWRDATRRATLSLFGTSTSGPTTHAADDEVARRTLRLPVLTRLGRAALWSKLSEGSVPPPVLDWPLLPSDIVRAAAAAAAGAEAVLEACSASLRVDSGSLLSKLPRPYVSGDLILPPSVRRHLDEFEVQARLRWSVYEEWGFERLCPMGRGIAALFAGPSGTGKTMAAQVLARSLGMEIYRVDLAGVVSKYIGETEKNLRQLFDACERANVLLFFDEADALFGQRTEVKDAHDRFANIEIDYLLQRMEQFDGIAVLATNRRSDIDSAFLRRVRFIVDFLPPGVAERRALWTLALPARTPAGEELLGSIDWDLLAQRLDMTGADIKAAAMGAAFLARSEGARIGMAHVMHAARRELAKRGVVVRAGDLGG